MLRPCWLRSYSGASLAHRELLGRSCRFELHASMMFIDLDVGGYAGGAGGATRLASAQAPCSDAR